MLYYRGSGKMDRLQDRQNSLSGPRSGHSMISPCLMVLALLVAITRVQASVYIDAENEIEEQDGTQYIDQPNPVTGMTFQQQVDILDTHNYYRGQEGASDMNHLHWDITLAEIAATWAAECNFSHHQPAWDWASTHYGTYQELGQNLYFVTRKNNDTTTADVAAYGKRWFDEKPYYEYDSMTCTKKPCGHYTQLTWAKSKYIGCALKRCDTIIYPKTDSTTRETTVYSYSNANYLACQYYPAGNYVGQKPFKKGNMCSNCTHGFYCRNDNSLCEDEATCNKYPGLCTCNAQVCEHDCTFQADAGCRCECGDSYGGVRCGVTCEDTQAESTCKYWKNLGYCDSYKSYMIKNCCFTCGFASELQD